MSRLSQLDSSQSLCEMRYTTKATYAAVPAEMRKPINRPLTSDRKKWSKRYPLITITSTATVHAALYSATTMYQILNFSIKEKKVTSIRLTTTKLAFKDAGGDQMKGDHSIHEWSPFSNSECHAVLTPSNNDSIPSRNLIISHEFEGE